MRKNSEFYYSQTMYLVLILAVCCLFWWWHFIPLYIKRKANTEAALTWKIEVVTWLYFYWPLFQLWSQFVPPRKFPLTTHLIILFSLLAYVWYLTYYISIYKYVSSTFPKKENYLSFVLQCTILSRNMSTLHKRLFFLPICEVGS
jgi:hypothetical protein